MFESLDESIRTDESRVTTRERLTHWAVITFGVVILLFGGLYVGLRYFQAS